MPDDRKRCWLMEGCPSRTGVCYSCVPDGDDCPIWRWFKKQIVVRCKDCVHAKSYGELVGCERIDGLREPEWFCADAERAEDDD